MAQEHVEVERKFDVPESFVLPDLTGVPGVAAVGEPEERQLEAVYHDTADLRLARTPVTLRRRTGGPDAGWHVKLPAGEGARRELHFPPGRATRTPPRAVRAPVRGLVRTAPVGPVATLRTTRRATALRDEAGRVLAEVADDTVTGTALPADAGEPATVVSWREVEVELVDGDDALLDAVAERLLAAGASPSTSASKLGRVLADRLALLPRADRADEQNGKNGKKAKKAKKGRQPVPAAGGVVLAAVAAQVRALQAADLLARADDPEGVHDVRVACRRLRSILAAFRPVLDRRVTDPLREELRWLGTELSPARDGEVALEHLRRMVGELPPELVLGPVAARLQQSAVAEHAAGRRVVDRALDSARYLALLDDLVALVDRPPLTAAAEDRADEVLAAAVRQTAKRLRRRVDAARDDAAEARLHEVRKAVKRVRYTAEVAAEVLGGPAQELVACAKEVQELLGDRQDTVLTRDRSRTLGLAAFAAGENAWTFGLLHGLERARAERAAEQFWQREPALTDAARRAGRVG